jgi:hypothetical protein
MSILSAELTVIETTVWWFQKLGKDFSKKNEQHRSFIWRIQSEEAKQCWKFRHRVRINCLKGLLLWRFG